MNPSLVRTSLRVVAFLIVTSIGGLIFSEIEHRAESNYEDKDDLLEALRKDMETKYNMTAADFENFTQLSYIALAPAGPAWTYFDGLRFSFETLTTIGKKFNYSLIISENSKLSDITVSWEILHSATLSRYCPARKY